MVEVEVKVSSSESRVHLCVLCRCSFASPWVSALASQRVSSCIALGVSSCLLLQSGLPLASQGKTGSSRAHAVFVSFSFFLSFPESAAKVFFKRTCSIHDSPI